MARKTFFGHLFATPTLAPVFLGLLAAAAVLLFMERRHQNLAVFLAVVGALAGLGMLLTLLLLSRRRRLDPALGQLRKELLDSLKTLQGTQQRTACHEVELGGTAAQTERV